MPEQRATAANDHVADRAAGELCAEVVQRAPHLQDDLAERLDHLCCVRPFSSIRRPLFPPQAVASLGLLRGLLVYFQQLADGLRYRVVANQNGPGKLWDAVLNYRDVRHRGAKIHQHVGAAPYTPSRATA